ncbi:hypothetical protein PBF_24593 [Cytobacillus firmus DS1]|uniref:Uncharacterized protein n=2 Tax=Cytobacillus firmus TaxID=1399 RepID=W7KYD0_CYTFI|nr:hypothetical protein PBF_24593 [Cytobacillus firmus DS1]
MSATQEVEDMREQDVKELKEGIKDLQKILHDVDKTVSNHTIKFENLGNIKELAERTSESAKSAHKRIDQVKQEFREEIDEMRESQKKQFEDFKELVQSSDKKHEENYKGIKAFALRVFFLFVTPMAAGLAGLIWLIFNKGLGLK